VIFIAGGICVNSKSFIQSTIIKLDDIYFEELKEKLLGEYLSFSFFEDADVTREILAEKICDYFDKLELKTGRTFEKYVYEYASNWDKLVSGKVAKEPQVKKNETPLPVPRARKYFKYASEIIKSSRQLTVKQLLDYSRIMMCLYMAIVTGKSKEITDFEYSTDVLSIEKLVSSMKSERATVPIKIGKKLMFDTEELFSSDTCTFILTMIMYYHIKNNAVLGAR